MASDLHYITVPIPAVHYKEMIMNKVSDKKTTLVVAMQQSVLPSSRLGSATSVSRKAIVSVYGASVADAFNPKSGYCFIGFRTSPKAIESDRLIAGQALGAMKAGKLDNLPADVQCELYRIAKGLPADANVTGAKLAPAPIAILIMGRYPVGDSTKGYSERKGKGCTLPASAVSYINTSLLPLIGMDKAYNPHNKNRVADALATLADTDK